MDSAKKKGLTGTIAISVIVLFVTAAMQGCKTAEPKKGGLQMCDTDIKSKCSGECIDGFEPRYYFDSRNIQSVKDEADNRIAFLKRQGLGDLDDYPEILNNEKKHASFGTYFPPECSGCKPKFILKGSEVKCEDFYQYIETLNGRCGGCVEIVPDKIKKN
ncbi:MAG TPA: hypothetical protein P5120_02575 [Spirochaetota bacterium]|nr:hypothetical protein [Spirochaetota bacterium]HPF06385.1 hypothetical protein [Spirochaetota bacterium]HPJ43669.1 hypothetical protein [Spirochaetota bacterium]HPR38800.1 hypothetical protein [Spirochaetota bacterium]HRX46379.1 hypothetical protein [Spirochaetota bacterium]